MAVFRLMANNLAALTLICDVWPICRRLTLEMEIGVQNAGLGVVLAHFSRITALPGPLFAVWCISSRLPEPRPDYVASM
jgi:hypothetical protein